jgi:DMSO reductase family type II enzyme chaperone
MTASPDVGDATRRAEAYHLLAEAFSYPDEDLLQALLRGEFQADLGEVMTGLPTALLDEVAVAPETGFADMEAAYLSAFELDMPSSPCPLYEGSHVQGADRSAILLEVKSFYGHFGLAVAEDKREPEDHLTAELEFMQFLAAKQADAEQGGRDPAPYVRAQRDFVERHLANWLPSFAATAEQRVASPFYKALSRLAASFVSLDFQHVMALPAARTAGACGARQLRWPVSDN